MEARVATNARNKGGDSRVPRRAPYWRGGGANLAPIDKMYNICYNGEVAWRLRPQAFLFKNQNNLHFKNT
jgi:hypothetical protein